VTAALSDSLANVSARLAASFKSILISDGPVLLTILFRFLCHSRLAKSKPHRTELAARIQSFLLHQRALDLHLSVVLNLASSFSFERFDALSRLRYL
jgi:hypothetical protein